MAQQLQGLPGMMTMTQTAEVIEALRNLEQVMRDLLEQSDAGAVDYLQTARRGHGEIATRLEAAQELLKKHGMWQGAV